MVDRLSRLTAPVCPSVKWAATPAGGQAHGGCSAPRGNTWPRPEPPTRPTRSHARPPKGSCRVTLSPQSKWATHCHKEETPHTGRLSNAHRQPRNLLAVCGGGAGAGAGEGVGEGWQKKTSDVKRYPIKL